MTDTVLRDLQIIQLCQAMTQFQFCGMCPLFAVWYWDCYRCDAHAANVPKYPDGRSYVERLQVVPPETLRSTYGDALRRMGMR